MRSRGAPVLTLVSTCWRLLMPPPGLCPFIAIGCSPLTSLLGGSRWPILQTKDASDDFLHHPRAVLREVAVSFTRTPQKLRGDLPIQIASRDEHAELPSGVVEAVVSARSLGREVGPKAANATLCVRLSPVHSAKDQQIDFARHPQIVQLSVDVAG